jgi:hypothetical protein
MDVKTELKLSIDCDTHRFLRVEAVLATGGTRNMGEITEAELRTQIQQVISDRRRAAWRRSLDQLLAAGLCGAEVLALFDVGQRHSDLESDAAMRDALEIWHHLSLSPQRWKRLVDLLQTNLALRDAFFIVANELVGEDNECRYACVKVYGQR